MTFSILLCCMRVDDYYPVDLYSYSKGFTKVENLSDAQISIVLDPVRQHAAQLVCDHQKEGKMQNQFRYSSTSTINHWITALLVVVMLALGYAVAGAPSETIEEYILDVHVSLGFFVFLFVVWRAAFRLYEGFPENIEHSRIERWTAYVVHRTILLLLVIMVFTGPLYLFTENECVNVFNWFSVCVPLESVSFIHGTMEWIHINIGIYLLPALIVLHIIGAIRHYATSEKRQMPTDM